MGQMFFDEDDTSHTQDPNTPPADDYGLRAQESMRRLAEELNINQDLIADPNAFMNELIRLQSAPARSSGRGDSSRRCGTMLMAALQRTVIITYPLLNQNTQERVAANFPIKVKDGKVIAWSLLGFDDEDIKEDGE